MILKEIVVGPHMPLAIKGESGATGVVSKLLSHVTVLIDIENLVSQSLGVSRLKA
jgi:hypothetical protein